MKNTELREFVERTINKDVINLSDEDFNGLYNKWFEGEKSDNYTFSRDTIRETQNIPDNAYMLGVDLPYWFGDFDKSSKKIMIVGIDPLRNKGAFKAANADVNKNVLISSPYALHSKELREGKLKTYWALIKKLQTNNFIYLTDVYKSFFLLEVD